MRVVTSGRWRPGGAARVLAAAALLVGVGGCELDKQESPQVNGPSETGLSAQLTALPDVVNADGVSEAVVELVLRDQDGNPAGGRAILFQLLSGDGAISPSAASTFVGPVQTGLVMATAQDGTAVVVYVAGTRYTTATIGVKPYGFDTTNVTGFLRTVEIIQR
jgi:hypothetical protein